MKRLKRFLLCERGTTAVEAGIIAALCVVALAAVLGSVTVGLRAILPSLEAQLGGAPQGTATPSQPSHDTAGSKEER
jgi:Flp pilus assembly pilin Flp